MSDHFNEDQKSGLSSNKEPIIAKDTFAGLIEVIVENDHKCMEAESDPLELYIDKLKSRLHNDAALFHTRFAAGYASLLKQLKYEHSAHEIPKPDDK